MKQIKNEGKKQRIAKKRTKKTRERKEDHRVSKYIRKETELKAIKAAAKNKEERILKQKLGGRRLSTLEKIKRRKRGSFLSKLVSVVKKRISRNTNKEVS